MTSCAVCYDIICHLFHINSKIISKNMGGSQPCICIEMVQHKSSQDCQVNYRESHKNYSRLQNIPLV